MLRCGGGPAPREPLRVRVGALGMLTFRPGFYCYVGSARGGLRARLARHLRTRGKRAHWHVDYLRRRCHPAGILVRAGERADECTLSNAVARLADGSVPRFGSSDCGCASHLHYFAEDPGERLRSLHGVRWVGLQG